MIREPTSGERPVLSASRRDLQLLRTAGPGRGLYVLVVSRAAEGMRAHAKRCRTHPVYGSRVRWSGTDFAESFRVAVSLSEDDRYSFEIV
jgi:hypothetical protein